jgi:hypothetical protein
MFKRKEDRRVGLKETTGMQKLTWSNSMLFQGQREKNYSSKTILTAKKKIEFFSHPRHCSSPLYTDACFSRKHPPSSFIQLTLPTSTICAPGTCAGHSVYAICFLGWSSLETICTSRGLMFRYAPVLMKGQNLLGRNYVSFMGRR